MPTEPVRIRKSLRRARKKKVLMGSDELDDTLVADSKRFREVLGIVWLAGERFTEFFFPLGDERHHDFFFLGKVVVDGSDGHTREFCDVLDARAPNPLGCEDPFRGIEDRLTIKRFGFLSKRGGLFRGYRSGPSSFSRRLVAVHLTLLHPPWLRRHPPRAFLLLFFRGSTTLPTEPAPRRAPNTPPVQSPR